MPLTAEMLAALSERDPVIFGLLEVNLPEYNLRLVDGASKIRWGENWFLGKDATYGKWSATDAITDGAADSAPAASITLLPATAADAGELTAPSVQGSRVRIWFGVLDKATGQPVPDPYLLFDGELDQPILDGIKRGFSLDYELVSVFERLFVLDEELRLSDAHHQDVWPGELGCQYISGLVRTIIWGPGDRPAGISYGSSAGGGLRAGGYLERVAQQ